MAFHHLILCYHLYVYTCNADTDILQQSLSVSTYYTLITFSDAEM